jgi:hypothetical protein
VALFATALALVGACGDKGSKEEADKPDCPSTTVAEPTGTSTVDPRCVISAEEATTSAEEGDQAGKPQLWVGTISGESSFPGVNCFDGGTINGSVTVNVTESGALSGTLGEVVRVSDGGCVGGVSYTSRDPSRPILGGTKTRDEIQLTFYQGVTAILAIDGNRATGTVSGGYEGATVGDLGSRQEVILECQNC